MESTISKIETTLVDFNTNLEAFKKGNASAGRRARKNSLELEKLFKTFRKESVVKA